MSAVLGLVGYNNATITNSYSTGSVTGQNNVGGLVGYNDDDEATITNSFWNIDIYTTNNGFGTGKTTAKMQQQSTFTTDLEAGSWDFETIWTIDEDVNFPCLQAFIPPVPPVAEAPTEGDGSETNPYEIASLNNLYWLSQNQEHWDKHYIQTADIDATTTNLLDNGKGFTPIGTDFNNSGISFTGTYNGQGNTISNLFIDRPNTDYVGLFGCVFGENSKIENLGIIDADIKGKDSVGSLVGFKIMGSIINSYSTGEINGNNSVGGLVGNNAGTVSNSYSTGNVTGNDYVGGLTGYNSQGINNSYSQGNVTGNDKVGGLVGSNIGSITNSYSTGIVTGRTSNVGGLFGNNGTENEIVSNSFWNTTNNPLLEENNGIGKSTDEMKQQSTFTTWDFELIWAIDETKNNGYPYLDIINKWFVETTGDDTNNDGLTAETPFLTIAHAIDVSENGDIIQIGEGTFTENINVNKDLTIKGEGASFTTIDGNNYATVINVSEDVISTIESVKITNGFEEDTAPGGINNLGNLTLNYVFITENSGFPGGISHEKNNLTINNSTISNNTSEISGGIYLTNNEEVSINLSNVTIANNSGGGILIELDPFNNNSDIIFNATNLTLANNYTEEEPAGKPSEDIGNEIEIVVNANKGNSISTLNMTLVNTILQNENLAFNINGSFSKIINPINITRYNTLVSDASMQMYGGSNNLDNQDAMLDEFTDHCENGILVYALQDGSPAIDAGIAVFNPADKHTSPTIEIPEFDQCDNERVDATDIGALEYSLTSYTWTENGGWTPPIEEETVFEAGTEFIIDYVFTLGTTEPTDFPTGCIITVTENGNVIVPEGQHLQAESVNVENGNLEIQAGGNVTVTGNLEVGTNGEVRLNSATRDENGELSKASGSLIVGGEIENNGSMKSEVIIDYSSYTNYNAYRKFYISKPISNVFNTSNFQFAADGGKILKLKNGRNTEVINEPMDIGRGYDIRNVNAQTVTFEGTFNNNATYPLSAPPSKRRSALAGNPYPCAISWDKPEGWERPNLRSSVYIWSEKESRLSSWNPTNQTGTNGREDGIIPAMCGFIVKASKNNPSLTVKKSARVHHEINQNEDKHKNFVNNLLRLKVTGKNYSDETVIILNDFISEAENTDKMFEDNEELPHLFTMSDDNFETSINNLFSEDENISIPLHFIAGEHGEFSMEITENNLNAKNVFIEDKNTGEIKNLENYKFNSKKSDSEDRFVLHFSNENLENIAEESVKIYSYEKSIYIDNPFENANVIVYDIAGRKVFEELLNEKSLIKLDIAQKSGTYFVKFYSNNKIVNAKIIIK